MLSALAASLAAATSIGVFGHTLARFDRDSLQPVGPQTQILEPHAPGVLDPATGEITARRRTGTDALCRLRPEAFAAGAIFPLLRPGADPRLAIVDPRGRIKVVRLQLRLGRGTCPAMGLAIDRAGNRAFAFTGDGRVAEVSLRTRRVRYHRTEVRSSARRWRAAWVPRAGLAVVAAGAGLHMLDPKTWRTRWRARRAKDLALSGRALVTAGDGVSAYGPDGRRRFHALGSRAMGWFQVASGRIYADDGRALNVLDATTGAIRARLPPTNFGFWFL